MDEDSFSLAQAPQNISLFQVMGFVETAECGAIGAAARRLYRSQPYLSRSIKELEEALGVPLFCRSRTGVSLSEHGQTFLPMAKRLLLYCSDAHASMKQWRDAHTPSMSVTGSIAVMHVILPTLLRSMRSAFGCASMTVGEALSADVVKQVVEGRATLGVCSDVEHHAMLRYTPVLEAQFGILGRPDCQIPERINSLRDLQGLTFVRCADDAFVTRALHAAGVEFPAYFDSSVKVARVPAATELLHAFRMATVATGISASHARAAGLRFVPLPGLLPAATVNIVSRKDALYDEKAEQLREVLRHSLHDAPWHPEVRRLGADVDSRPSRALSLRSVSQA